MTIVESVIMPYVTGPTTCNPPSCQLTKTIRAGFNAPTNGGEDTEAGETLYKTRKWLGGGGGGGGDVAGRDCC